MNSDDAFRSRSERGESSFFGHGGRRPTVLAHGGYSVRWLTQDERYLYWSDRDNGEIVRLPKHGGVPMVLASVETRVVRTAATCAPTVAAAVCPRRHHCVC